MNLQERIKNELSKWMLVSGPEADVVVSSRVRLARNLCGIPFPNRADEQEAKQVYELVETAIQEQSTFPLQVVDLSTLTDIERTVLAEKYLISPQHTVSGVYKGVAFSSDEVISVMINEEDHIRSQVIYPGFQLEEAFRVANQLDNTLEAKLDFAFSEKFGYLTACPTNVGTGMRASVMMHLPGLTLANRLQPLLHSVNQLGLAVRGVFGEGSEAKGDLYQISNQVSLGRSEEEIIDNLKKVTEQIIQQERHMREQLLQQHENDLKDRIMRSYGLLMYAHKLTSDESVRMLSDVKLGIDLGIITNVNPSILTELMILTRPGYLQKLENKVLSGVERDLQRATLIRKRMRLSQG